MHIKDEIKKLENFVKKHTDNDPTIGIQAAWLFDALKIINKLQEVVEMQQESFEQIKNINQELPRDEQIFEGYKIACGALEKSKQLLEGDNL